MEENASPISLIILTASVRERESVFEMSRKFKLW